MSNLSKKKIIIEKKSGWAALNLMELWEFRDLAWFHILKEIKAKYRQMALGPLWIILQPVMNMVVFTFAFGKIANLDSDGIPYPLLTFSGLIPWLFFQNSCIFSSNSLVQQMGIISKVYFPRLLLPICNALSWIVDFCITFAILLLMMAYYDIFPTWRIVYIPLYVLMALVTTLGISFWAATLTVKFRDVKILVTYGLRIFMYFTPVAYTATAMQKGLPEGWAWLLKINPMYWVIEGFRWSLIGGKHGPEPFMLIPVTLIIILFVSGVFVFRRTERNIVDLL